MRLLYGVLLVIAASHDANAQAAVTPCWADSRRLLLLDEAEFDQSKSRGWRELAERNCKREAAALIARWRILHPGHSRMMFWHEGQLRADLGNYPQAISLFERARTPPNHGDAFGWNLYVDGTVAFLRSDEPSLLLAREQLAALPRPANLPESSTVMGSRIPTPWPLNLNVLDGLISCWGKRYVEAYGCATALFRYEKP